MAWLLQHTGTWSSVEDRCHDFICFDPSGVKAGEATQSLQHQIWSRTWLAPQGSLHQAGASVWNVTKLQFNRVNGDPTATCSWTSCINWGPCKYNKTRLITSVILMVPVAKYFFVFLQHSNYNNFNTKMIWTKLDFPLHSFPYSTDSCRYFRAQLPLWICDGKSYACGY